MKIEEEEKEEETGQDVSRKISMKFKGEILKERMLPFHLISTQLVLTEYLGTVSVNCRDNQSINREAVVNSRRWRVG